MGLRVFIRAAVVLVERGARDAVVLLAAHEAPGVLVVLVDPVAGDDLLAAGCVPA